ncbi:DUF2087 domain-containing protein [Afifella sp. IM 167]|uniref:DUF2087 domain-containing protein n=1 Tax=Afifella sp. IM 167 TaxID=2033586 RepID=UPI001CCDFCE1|nr:DUF2087 domain-containing protein [Afifella sp. IM 167]MBZ8134209.1 hypothetical protein [Afifella sp. IM 167]
MSRTPIAFHADDISNLSRVLRRELAERAEIPSHLEFLNILARAIGHGNFQEFRTSALQTTPAEPGPAPAMEPAEKRRMERLLRCFDGEGRLERWPKKRSEQVLALWILWARVPAGQTYSEAEIGGKLREWHTFHDHALLRRELCDLGLMQRTPDGSVYRRVEREMPAEALAVARRVPKAA